MDWSTKPINALAGEWLTASWVALNFGSSILKQETYGGRLVKKHYFLIQLVQFTQICFGKQDEQAINMMVVQFLAQLPHFTVVSASVLTIQEQRWVLPPRDCFLNSTPKVIFQTVDAVRNQWFIFDLNCLVTV